MKNYKIIPLALIIQLAFFKLAMAQSDTLVQVLEPGIISTGYNERDLALSPDGTEMFYTLLAPRFVFSVLVHSRKINGQWTTPEVALFSGEYADMEPAFSPDGQKLYFVSRRPVQAEEVKQDFDIWYVTKKNGTWSAPQHTGPELNSTADEFYPSVTQDGSIYFTAALAENKGEEDIYKAKFKHGEFEKPVNIGGGVNTALDEFNAFVDPAENYLLFSAVNGEGDNGRGDLYISFRNEQGEWGQPKNLGPSVNSPRLDYCPFVQHDTLYFTSERARPLYEVGKKINLREFKSRADSWGNGAGDIYSVRFSDVLKKLK